MPNIAQFAIVPLNASHLTFLILEVIAGIVLMYCSSILLLAEVIFDAIAWNIALVLMSES